MKDLNNYFRFFSNHGNSRKKVMEKLWKSPENSYLFYVAIILTYPCGK